MRCPHDQQQIVCVWQDCVEALTIEEAARRLDMEDTIEEPFTLFYVCDGELHLVSRGPIHRYKEPEGIHYGYCDLLAGGATIGTVGLTDH